MISSVGYDLHITRRSDWSDADSGPPISRNEFERVVLGDLRFRRDEALGPNYAVLVKKPLADWGTIREIPVSSARLPLSCAGSLFRAWPTQPHSAT